MHPLLINFGEGLPISSVTLVGKRLWLMGRTLLLLQTKIFNKVDYL